jgi:molybdopterin molybdotransferase
MALLSVEDALARVLDGVEATEPETVAVEAAHGRVLAAPLAALLTQPPFPASAMDGYAVRAADVARLPATLTVTGTAAAGHPYAGRIGPGEAVRIFTGAPVPDGADALVIQENAVRDGDTVVVREGAVEAEHIRRTAMDFRTGDTLLAAGRRLGPRELSLAAAMGHGSLTVRRPPRVAVLATGDELVPPGVQPGAGQFVASNHLCIAGIAQTAGAEVRQLGIARDTREDLARHIALVTDMVTDTATDMANGADGADVLVTIGGASVGDHDLVAPVLAERGGALAFWKIDMRPGKPLMYGRLGATRMLGLPGNPASATVCARLFLVPLIWSLLGRPIDACVRPIAARLAAPLGANGTRQHYMRAASVPGAEGVLEVAALPDQHSSLITPLAEADCLLIRPPHAPALAAGGMVPVLRLDV